MQSFLERILLTIGDWNMNVGQLVVIILFLTMLLLLWRVLLRPSFISKYLVDNEVGDKKMKKLKFMTFYFFLFAAVFFILQILDLDYSLYSNNEYLKLSLIFQGLMIIQAARIIDWLISNVFIHKYYVRRDNTTEEQKRKATLPSPEEERSASKSVQYIVYLAAAFLLIKNLHLDFTLFGTTVTNEGGASTDIEFKVSKILTALLILLVARLLVWIFTELFLYRVYRRKKIDAGSRFAINQLIKYFAYFIAFFIALDHVGINMTLIWTGAAALLVGIGLGLQQTFNDFMSGIVLLFERTTSVGDILEFDNKLGKVLKIGMRTSILETRFNKTVVVPNSKMVNENVINWSHYQNRVRFEVNVGVAYGSDTHKVRDILIEVAKNHPDVLKYPKPFVRFINFGNSSLDFSLSFFSKNYMFIEDVLSDLRFQIDQRFREEKVTIPFPQMDIWYRNQPQT